MAEDYGVPPGFRFHPTDEELLDYYLRKKVNNKPIELDVIREIDLYKLEPWDIQDACRLGSAADREKEWYFFSHRGKKYPKGTRTNRATTAGFWKATGKDKAIYMSNSRRIGMRKTLVFYIGRTPIGKRTNWIMHEYHLRHKGAYNAQVQDNEWVVCKLYEKKNYGRTTIQDDTSCEEDLQFNIEASASVSPHNLQEPKLQKLKGTCDPAFDGSTMLLPQLMSPEAICAPILSVPPPTASNSKDVDSSQSSDQSLLRLTLSGGHYGVHSRKRFNLAAADEYVSASPQVNIDVGTSDQKFQFHSVGWDCFDQ